LYVGDAEMKIRHRQNVPTQHCVKKYRGRQAKRKTATEKSTGWNKDVGRNCMLGMQKGKCEIGRMFQPSIVSRNTEEDRQREKQPLRSQQYNASNNST
jgi:hypothetical protein